MKGAIKKAEELVEEHGYFMPQRFKNEANPKIHELTTGPEIVKQMKDAFGRVVSGIGTGGTITGAGKVLREHFPNIKIFAVEPKDSPVLSGGKPRPHKIQRNWRRICPAVLNTEIYDEVITIANEEAFEAAREVARKEGILGGISIRCGNRRSEKSGETSRKRQKSACHFTGQWGTLFIHRFISVRRITIKKAILVVSLFLFYRHHAFPCSYGKL